MNEPLNETATEQLKLLCALTISRKSFHERAAADSALSFVKTDIEEHKRNAMDNLIKADMCDDFRIEVQKALNGRLRP